MICRNKILGSAGKVKNNLLEALNIEQSVFYAEIDFEFLCKASTNKLKAEELLPAVDAGLAQVGDDMDPQDLNDIEATVAEVRGALEGTNANKLKAAVQRLDKSTEHMAAILVEKAMEAALMRKLED